LSLKKKPRLKDSEIIEKALVDLNNRFAENDLKLFGNDLFAGEPVTFQPNANVPVEPDYLLGPGDELNIQFYGKVNEYFEQTIQRDGTIGFPKIGSVGVAGITYAEVKRLIKRKVSEEYIGVKVNVSVGALRSMQVFVFGEAYKPGRYTVPSLSTITNVLYLSGGVSEIASIRNIQIKRQGKILAVFDLYDLLLKGDRSGDIRLQAGDTIFIPTIAKTASIQGQVRRAAIYEVKEKSTVGDLVELAGGLLPKAYQAKARIRRVDPSGFMTVVDLDLKTKRGLDTQIKNGDFLVVDPVAEASNNTVTLLGHVYHSGDFLWQEGLRVTDLVPSIDVLKPNPDLNAALIMRKIEPHGTIITLSLSLMDIFSDPKSAANYLLKPKDQLIVFGTQEKGRAESLAELVMQLKQQSRMGEVAKVVSIFGAVPFAGEYPMTKNMTLIQLVKLSGGLTEQAYNQFVEITRSDFSNGKAVVVSHQTINLKAIISGEQPDISLSPYDQINIRAVSDYREIMSITISGEVLLPGKNTILENETLSAVIKRAGGLTDSAHVEAAIFTRKKLREREIQKIKLLRNQVQADIAAVSLRGGKNISKENKQQMLSQLDTKNALGRLVIDLEAIIRGDMADVIVKDGDHLVIPEWRQEVSVMGEVPWPSSHQYNPNLKIKDYIELAGGAGTNADKAKIYVVKVNGAVSIPSSSIGLIWQKFKIEPGDTIVVPMDMDSQTSFGLWSDITSIIYQLSLGAAAIKNM
jgi:protein involved in polysaccharide export with SLBB domain